MNRYFAQRALSVGLALSLALAPLAARAAAPGDAVAQARQHFTRGVKLYQEDDFRAALIEFSRAYELAPNWQVLYDVGQAYYQLREYASALRTLEKYVAQGGAQIAPDRRAQVEREMDELRGRVALVVLAIDVAGADVTLDDAPLGKAPFAAPVLVGAGRHRITAAHEGYVPATKVVDIAGGDDVTIKLDLALAPRDRPADAVVAPLEKPSYAAPIALFVVGGAGIAVGAVFGAMAVGNKSTLNGECRDKVCPAAAQGDIDAFSRNGLLSTIGFGAGVVGVALGAALALGARGGEQPARARAAVRPWVGLGNAGVAGSF